MGETACAKSKETAGGQSHTPQDGDHLDETFDTPETFVKNQSNFRIRGIAVAISQVKTFNNDKVLFSVLLKLAVCSSLLKVNFWSNFARIWSKRIVVGQQLTITNGLVRPGNVPFRITSLEMEVFITPKSNIEIASKPSPDQELHRSLIEELTTDANLRSSLVHIEKVISSIHQDNSARKTFVLLKGENEL